MAYDEATTKSLLAGLMEGCEKMFNELMKLKDMCDAMDAQERVVMEAESSYFRVADASMNAQLWPEDISLDDKMRVYKEAAALIGWDESHPLFSNFMSYAKGEDINKAGGRAYNEMLARYKDAQATTA